MLPERFLNKFEVADNGCWIWNAQISPDGYGRFNYRGGQLAHRFAYEAAKGQIPDGLVIDHLCENKRCVNVDHLEVTTPGVNTVRSVSTIAGRNVRKTHCVNGHEFTPENILRRKSWPADWRECRECQRIARHSEHGRELARQRDARYRQSEHAKALARDRQRRYAARKKAEAS